MAISPPDDAAPTRGADAFGMVRLMLAGLVILAHTPELHDGNRGREPLTRLFGTISFGELAVDGFFIVSGFLITGSFLATRSIPEFAAKRAARLLPGFWLASLVGVAVVAPLGGGLLAAVDWGQAAWRILTLRDIAVPHLFADLPHHSVNGAVWTLAYEARCYALVALLGWSGVLRRPLVLAALAGACLDAQAFLPAPLLLAVYGNPIARALIDNPYAMLRLAAQFLAGAALWNARARLRPTPVPVALAAGVLVLGLRQPLLAEPAIASAGAWLLLSVALHPPSRWMTRVNARDDVSYGVYLYAWPTTNLLMWELPGLPLLALGCLTMAITMGLGMVSWRLVEQPAQAAVRRRRASRSTSGKERSLVPA